MNKDKILERKIYKRIKDVTYLRVIKGSSTGCSGTYFQIDSKTGIKVLCERFSTIERAYKNRWAVDLEVRNGKLVNKLIKLSPRIYRSKLIKISGEYAWIIIQQHLGDISLDDFKITSYYDRTLDYRYRIQDMLKYRLKKVGLKHDDLHHRNIMMFKSKPYIIDFSSIIKLPKC